MWAVFGEMGLTGISIQEDSVVLLLLWLFVLVAGIGMVNLLVAMFADTCATGFKRVARARPASLSAFSLPCVFSRACPTSSGRHRRKEPFG